MYIPVSILIGYLFGCINPAAIISKIKHKKLTDKGTGNLGATNVTLVFGKKYGAFVMLFDIIKAFAAFKVAKLIFATNALYAGMIAGFFAVIGHCFPFYLRFKGGKGLAAFGGFVLAFDPIVFLMLFGFALVLMIIVNYSFVVPYSGSILFPVLAYVHTGDLIVFGFAALAGVLIMYKHFENILKARKSKDIKVRDFFKRVFKKNNEPENVSATADTNE